jgi:phosphoglucosamine mutase
LSELKKCLRKFPQTQRNLRVQRKPPLSELPRVNKLVQEAEQKLGESGRVLLRYSGTEPKVRLLIEGPDLDAIEQMANGIAEELQKAIGVHA